LKTELYKERKGSFWNIQLLQLKRQ